MTTNTAAATATPPATKYKPAKRLSCSRRERRKPLYQAVFAPTLTSRRAESAAADCIKDGVFIDPPYNTGSGFVDRDGFARNRGEYCAEADMMDPGLGQTNLAAPHDGQALTTRPPPSPTARSWISVQAVRRAGRPPGWLRAKPHMGHRP
ncbi:MAG: hypothetical protein LBS62_12475 [Clostridiales bacterium]|nr:hypothetical protein [Clostridiales bacterium]